MENEPVDYLIIGQGLAGTCLAFSLIKRGQKVLVVDFDGGARCSRIAAGTINPISFKTFGLVWKAEILVPFLQSFYKEIGEYLDTEVFIDRSILKVFKSIDQQNLWLKKADLDSSKPFMDSEIGSELRGIKTEFGYGIVHNAGNVNLPLLMDKFKENLRKKNLFIQHKFEMDQTIRTNIVEQLNNQGIRTKMIIFGSV